MQRVFGRYGESTYAAMRIVFGFLFFCHGFQKLAGAFGGPRFPVGSLLGGAGIIETFGGLLIAVGLFTSPVALVCAAEMVVAYFIQHAPRGGLPIQNGGELAVLYCFAFLFILTRGGGWYSVDNLRAPRLGRIAAAMILLLGAVACGRQTDRGPATRVYVTNETSGELSIIDAAKGTVVSTITLGKRPRGIAVSPDRATLYIALSGSPIAGPGVDEATLPPADKTADGIGVVDVKSGRVVKMLPGGSDPEQVAVSRDGTKVFAANEDAAALSVVDVATGRVVDSVKIGGEPEGVAVTPDNALVYATSEADGEVFVVDPKAAKVVTTVEVPPRPRGIAFLPDGSRAYITSENGAAVTVIDAGTRQATATIALGEGVRPMGLAVAPDGKFLYVSTGRTRQVLFIDTATNQVVGKVEAGPRPWGIGITADGKTLFTANGPSNDVSVIDIATRRVVQKIPVGRGPWGIAVASAP